jgi:hypothetical protein
LLPAILCPATFAEDSGSAASKAVFTGTSRTTVEPAVWQGPSLTAQLVPAASSAPGNASLPTPPQTITSSTTTTTTAPVAPMPTVSGASPLLDGKLPSEELIPPVVTENKSTPEDTSHDPLKPYGGGHLNDWPWGCGGSPYRTGPGLCDDYKVGPRWHITVDGIVMHREGTDLVALEDQMVANNFFMGGQTADGGGTTGIPSADQFGYAAGGRITATSQVSRCAGYDVQAVYEGAQEWNASIVYPKEALAPINLVIPPNPNTEPAQPFPEGFEQRSLHYTSDLNSAELNFLRNCCCLSCDNSWRPFCGFRFIRFGDEINDTLNQERQVPLPGPQTGNSGGPDPVNVNDPIGPTSEIDRFNIYHLENNLFGFQIGMFHDTVQFNDRFALEGFANAGVYYNHVKYSNVMGIFTTQNFADNTRSTDTDDTTSSNSNIVNNDARTYDEISYEAEASLTGVCRLNRCWALRAGYQVLWMNHIHTADAAYLGTGDFSQDLLFYGWHAGIECRR